MVMRNLRRFCIIFGIFIVFVFVFLCFILSYKYLNDAQSEVTHIQTTKAFYSFNSLSGTKEFTCANLEDLQIGEKLGSGAYRDAYVGKYHNTKVAVKVVKERFSVRAFGQEIVDKEAEAEANCLHIFQQHKDSHVKVLMNELRTKCESWNVQHMLLEIVYHSIHKSDKIVENIGYCVRDASGQNQGNEDTKPADKVGSNNGVTQSSSVISLYEFANDLTEDNLVSLPLLYKLNQMREIVLWIASLNDTLAGPFGVGGFQFRHIAELNRKWVLIDLGSFDSGDIPCDKKSENILTKKLKKLDLIKPGEQCPVNSSCLNGVCNDPYELLNRHRFCDTVWKPLLKGHNIYDKEKCYNMRMEKYLDYLESSIVM